MDRDDLSIRLLNLSMLRRCFSTTRNINMKVIPVPCRSDNYMYVPSLRFPLLQTDRDPLPHLTILLLLLLSSSLRSLNTDRYILTDEATGATAVVDPYDPKKLEAAAVKEGISLDKATLLLTHHHEDHSGQSTSQHLPSS